MSARSGGFGWCDATTERMLRGPMPSLPAPVSSVLELFKGPLSNVRFADIDAAGLATLAAEAEAAAGEVERHEARLAELRHELAQRQEALLASAQRALAYARVYAENDEQLSEELNRIALPRAAKPRPIKAKPSAEPATEAVLEPGAAASSEQASNEQSSSATIEAVPRVARKARGRVAQPVA